MNTPSRARSAQRIRHTVARVGLMVGVLVSATLAFGGKAHAVLMTFYAAIEENQETPPTGSISTWTGTFTLDTSTSMVTYTITNTGAPLGSPEAAAHIHGPAPIGVPGVIIFPLPPGSPKVGAYGPLTPAQVADMRFGLHYVNVHSAGFLAGEVRGQILPTGHLPLDHYQCYKIKKDVITFPPTVSADDQFQSQPALEIKKPFLWCNPVDKNAGGIFNDIDHMLCYKVKGTKLDPAPHVQSVNQFGTQTLFAKKPFVLCVPGDKTIIP